MSINKLIIKIIFLFKILTKPAYFLAQFINLFFQIFVVVADHGIHKDGIYQGKAENTAGQQYQYKIEFGEKSDHSIGLICYQIYSSFLPNSRKS